MFWTLKKDTLYDKKEQEIGYFLPTANDKERAMIKNGDTLVDLVGEFVTEYDEGKTVTKKLFDSFSKIVDKKTDYKIIWQETREGELLNENERVIFFFVKSNSWGKLIRTLPEVYECAQNLLNNLSTTSKHETKKLYDQICDFYDKIHEE